MADYVVTSWEDFLSYNTSGNNIKFGNPHEINGEIILEGDGSQSNPFVASTYEEMLFATGATYIWEVKLIDKENKIYKYNDIYCRYDDSETTIDFNIIQPEGFAERLYFLADKIDFNGWTFLNIIIKYDMVFGNESNNAYTNGRFINLIKNNNEDGIYIHRPSYVTYCIFDIIVESTSSNNYAVFDELPSYSAITVHAKDGSNCKLSSDASYWVQNSVINLDVSCYWKFGDMALENCLITGNCETQFSGTIPLCTSYTKNTIFNFESTYAWSVPSSVSAITLLNSTKAPNVTSSAALFKLVPDEDMRSAQKLADLGLPIGVD